jgi:hypothetical protein
VYDGGYTAPSLGELGIIVGNNSHGSTVKAIEMRLGIAHTVCRNGRTVRFVAHTVHRDGGHVGRIEFGNITTNTLGVVSRRRGCVSGGQPNGDHCISDGGGRVRADDLNASRGEQEVACHRARQGE